MLKIEEKGTVHFVTITLNPGGHSYQLLLKCIAAGNFGLSRIVEKRRPERFQTVEAARRFAKEQFAIDENQIKVEAGSL